MMGQDLGVCSRPTGQNKQVTGDWGQQINKNPQWSPGEKKGQQDLAKD